MVAAVAGDEKRLGLVVSRRVGCAVERNRIKRVIREYFQSNPNEFPKGDCVVIAQPGLVDLDNSAIRSTLSRALAGLSKRVNGEP
jgi:ribonuclease P protein component